MSYYILNLILSGAALLLSVMGLWFTIIIPGINRWNRRFFLIYFLIFLLCCLYSFFEMAFQYYIGPGSVFIVLLFMESILLSIPQPMLTVYLLHSCGENIRSGNLFRTVLGLWVIYCLVLLSAAFINGFIYITPENQYYHGPLYPLIPIPVIVVLLLNFTGTIRRRAQLSRKAFLSLVIAQVPMAVTLILNLFIDAVLLFDISYVLSALVMYSLILSDQIDQDLHHQQKIAEQQREIARQRANVMVLQMRPHFIYNTLVSIHSLCKINPQKAQQITMDFTNYLRRNFNAVASDSSIPFSMELEHTRAYLAVEQAQHEDMLFVDYDTPFINFRLPPLTLQPIVENAVKHGMDPYHGPLHISIRTRNTDSGTELIVDDNGIGFDPSDESRPHTALDNIRQRLEIMCGGHMTITPRECGGTVVTITIPDNTAQ